MEEGYIHALAPKGLTGAKVVFPKVSVGATEDLLMAACLASGETPLMNAAREPEVTDLGECLMKIGAEIEGLGADRINIRGVERSEEHPSELQSLLRISYAVSCLNKKRNTK